MGSQINTRGDVLVLGNRYQSFWCRSVAGMRICRAGLGVYSTKAERKKGESREETEGGKDGGKDGG